MDAQQATGFVIWLTGMTGAGKTTLGNHLYKRLTAAGVPAEFLDGDDPGEILTRGLGVSKEDRMTAVRRLGAVAKMVARHGGVTIVASLSPFREDRDAVRRDVRRIAEVFVDAPMETLLARDGEGMYKRALAHELKNVAGIDDPYEPPSHAELVVRSDQERPDAAAARLFQKLVEMKFLAPADFGKLTGGQRPKRAVPGKGGGQKAPKGARKVAPAKPAKSAKPAKAAKARRAARPGRR
jgi:adenylylsulfate kinase